MGSGLSSVPVFPHLGLSVLQADIGGLKWEHSADFTSVFLSRPESLEPEEQSYPWGIMFVPSNLLCCHPHFR